MKGTVAVFALGLAIPAEAQEPPDQVKAEVAVIQDVSPAALVPTQEKLASFRLENIDSPKPDLTLVLLPNKPRCAPVELDAIVVCGRHDNEKHRLRPLPALPPPGPTLMEKVGNALTWKIGPVVITPLGIGIAF